MFICGRRSFSNEDEDEDKNGSYMSPKRSKKSKSSSKRNPYADRGMGKFHTLLAELDEEKQKIYSQIGVEDISFVRFVYSDSFKHVRPIVVRAKNNNSQLKLAPNNSTTRSPAAAGEEIVDQGEEKGRAEEKKEETMKVCERWNGSFCFGVMMVLVLLFVVINGRAFAILCTTVMWYVVPTGIFGGTSSSLVRRKAMRKVSEKNTGKKGNW